VTNLKSKLTRITASLTETNNEKKNLLNILNNETDKFSRLKNKYKEILTKNIQYQSEKQNLSNLEQSFYKTPKSLNRPMSSKPSTLRRIPSSNRNLNMSTFTPADLVRSLQRKQFSSTHNLSKNSLNSSQYDT